MTLRPEDLIAAIKYLLKLRSRARRAEIDDIDHLGNRRLRTIDELASDELRKGFLKLRRTVQERMSLKDVEDMTPRSADQPQEHLGGDRVLLRPRRAVAGGRPDQSAVAADARAAAVGPGPGRFEPQAGRLRSARRAHLALRPHLPDRDAGRHEHRPDLQLAIYAGVDEYGFLITPYRKVSRRAS
jgi:DNA-directed RNA polymerase subunit beta